MHRASPRAHLTSLVFAGQRPGDLLALGRASGIGLLLSLEGGPAARAVAVQVGCELVSLEHDHGTREAWSSSALHRLAPMLARAPRGAALLSYAPDGAMTSAATRLGVAALGPSPREFGRLNEKDAMRRWLTAHGVEVPAWTITKPARLEPDALAWSGGQPVVVQVPSGSAGHGTHLVSTGDDAAQLRRTVGTAGRWVVSIFHDCASLNFHALLTDSRVIVSAPSLQVIGVPQLTELRFGYCGGDFSAAHDLGPAIVRQAAAAASRVAHLAKEAGWRGLLGVDLLATREGALVLEVNPRLQASSSLLAEVERAAGLIPLGHLHVAALTGSGDTKAGSARPSGYGAGAFLVLHQLGHAALVTALPPAGIHQVVSGGLVHLRRGVGLSDCRAEEVLVEGLPPAAPSTVARGAALARVHTWRQVVEADGRTLTEWGRNLVTATDRAITRTPA